MATKDNFLLFKKKHKSFNYCHIDAQYSDLNLNQNLKVSNIFPIQSNSKSYNNKKIDYTLSERYEEKEKSQTWKKSSATDLCSKYSNSLSLNDENKKCWKKNGSSNATNNSTLSLRISAYENSNEASVDSLNKSFQKSFFIQKQKQINPASKFVSQSPFEFQRQQNDKVPEPEVSQFKAFQRLFNLNKSDLHSNTAMAKPTKEEILAELEETQKERKEYVKNIGIEYRFGCYEENRGDSCHLLGEYMEAIEQNFKKSYELFRDNCEIRKYPKSCFKYSMYLLNGKECEPSFSKMLKPLEIACSDNLPPACRYLALVNWNGIENEKPNSKKAEEAMKKACDLEDSEACWMLSTWYLGPQTKFKTKGGDLDKQKRLGQLEKSPEKALEYGIRACEMNVPQSCANVSRMFRLGDGIPKNLEKAKEYHDKAAEIIELLKSRNVSAGFTGA